MPNQKTLKIKRVFAWTIYNSLRQTAPKDYPTTEEIKSTINVIMPALKTESSVYIDLVKRAVELGDSLTSKKITEEESKVGVDAINAEWKEYNRGSGLEVVNIIIDEEGLKFLRGQIERAGWGNNWIVNIEEYGEILEALNEAEK